MSALTDLFTAMANKIRSKTGGSDTYTPPEMVSDGIDDVYDAGVAAGTTPTQTKSVTAGTSQVTVTPDTGYALSSVTVDPTPSETKTESPNVSTNKEVTPTSGKLLSKVTITPQTHTGTYTPAANTAQNDMGAYHDKRYVDTSGMIVPSGNKSITANGTGIDVSGYATANVNVPNPTLSGNATAADVKSGKTFYGSNYTKQTGSYVAPTITSITPSNTSPVSMSSGSNYSPTASGYAISSYDNVTPTADGTYFSTGMKKMSAAGYAYSEKPTVQETTLWTNSSPTSSFNAHTITFTNPIPISNFDYIKITFRNGKSNATSKSAIFLSDDIPDSSDRIMIGMSTSAGNRARGLYAASTTSIYFSESYKLQTGSQTASSDYIIPISITGVKLP